MSFFSHLFRSPVFSLAANSGRRAVIGLGFRVICPTVRASVRPSVHKYYQVSLKSGTAKTVFKVRGLRLRSWRDQMHFTDGNLHIDSAALRLACLAVIFLLICSMSRVRLYWLVATRQLLNMRKISDVLYSLGDI